MIDDGTGARVTAASDPAPELAERQALAAPSVERSAYVASPWYDWTFFLAPPTVALAIGIAISGSRLASEQHSLFGNDVTVTGLFIGVFIHAHLVAVFFRSHGNTPIRRRHPVRFFVVPVALFAAMMVSPWAFVTASVLATFWDVYHSALQTFGFARMYDRKAGNDATVGRRLDWGLNVLLYAGPILAGATMLDHFEDFGEFWTVGSLFLTSVPAFMVDHHGYFTVAVLGGGAVFLVYYVVAYWRLHRRGYRISRLKVFLLTTTGLCSIYSWGFNSWGEAFFIMNFFHALQYFGIVWWSERDRIVERLRLTGRSWAKPAGLAALVGSTFVYGAFAELVSVEVHWWWSVTIVVSLMHFWYDGFIWSVRRADV